MSDSVPGNQTPEFETIELDHLLTSQTRKRRWIPQGLAIIIIFCILGYLILQPTLGQVFSFFTPLHTTTIVVFSNVSHATVTINSVSKTTDLPATFTFRTFGQPATIDMTIKSPPFMTQHCSLQWLNASGNTTLSALYPADIQSSQCRFDLPNNTTLTAQERKLAAGADIAASVFFNDSALSQSDQSTVLSMLNSQLTATKQTITITPGLQYVYNSGVLDTTHTYPVPITAQLAPTIDTPTPAPTTCHLLCSTGNYDTLQLTHTQSTGLQWNVAVQLKYYWSYYDTATGSYLGNHIENLNTIVLIAHLTLIHEQWNFTIATSILPFSLPPTTKPSLDANSLQCYDAHASFVGLASFLSYAKNITSMISVENHYPEGCVLEAFTLNLTTGQNIPALYLWRFGELFAINQNAQQIDPALPVANSLDLQLFAQSPLLQQNTQHVNR